VKDGFKEELKTVLPNFWQDRMDTESKATLMPKIDSYLKLVSKIANNKKAEANTLLPDVDISAMKRTDMLALFVKQDNSTFLLDSRAPTKQKHKLTAALISSCGTEIDERYVTANVPTSAHDDDDDDNDEEEDNDDDDDDDDNALQEDLEHLNDIA
jgi:hypothetical protein